MHVILIILLRLDKLYAHTYAHVYKILLFIVTCRNQQSSDQLSDIIWCREPFFEVMKEIEDMNYCSY